MYPILHKPWNLPDRLLTGERVYLDRRRFLKEAGTAAAGVFGLVGAMKPGRAQAQDEGAGATKEALEYVGTGFEGLFPAKKNATYVLDRDLSEELVAASYNNFYEFTTDKEGVWLLAQQFTQRPWEVAIGGLCERAGETVDFADIARIAPLEERNYRHRCVEAWAMAVPWTGFPLGRFVEWCRPRPGAQYIRFVSFLRPEQAVGQEKQDWYPWPYYEALRLDEAMAGLALLAFGIYGHPFPMQHGAPLRIVTPWKYGYKSIKSLVKIEFTAERPGTFWNDVVPDEYSFTSNVNPSVDHPRWSQRTERLIGTSRRVKTNPYNGYGEHVAHLYTGDDIARDP